MGLVLSTAANHARISTTAALVAVKEGTEERHALGLTKTLNPKPKQVFIHEL